MMGEVRQTVKVCDPTNKRRSCERVNALFDTGAATTVISRAVAEAAGVQWLRERLTIVSSTGHKTGARLALATIKAGDCRAVPTVVAVTDDVTKASGADIILGHDYMQKVGMRLDMAANVLAGTCARRRSRA